MSATFHHHALGAGYRLHWYRIESVLGQGGFGITYLATDTNLGQPVAIKEFLPADLAVRIQDSTVQPVSHDRSETFGWGLSSFLSEARTLARFRHPNIVHVYSVFEMNGTAYMVMEYEKGVSLEEAFKFRRIEGEGDLLSVVHALVDGLELVHEAGFIHRDIKPDNVLMRHGDAVPVLLDFGSARQAIGAATRTLTTLVTPGYAPFEQYNSTRDNDHQGPWTDVYSLAATLYRGITGKGPVDALTRADALLAGRPDPLPALARREPAGFSTALLQAVDAGMAFHARNRPQSLAEWRSLLPARPASSRPVTAAGGATTTPVSADSATGIRAPASRSAADDVTEIRAPAPPSAADVATGNRAPTSRSAAEAATEIRAPASPSGADVATGNRAPTSRSAAEAATGIRAPASPSAADAAAGIRAPAPAPAAARGPELPQGSEPDPARHTRGSARAVALTALAMVLLAAGGWGAWSLLSEPELPMMPAPDTTAHAPRPAIAGSPLPDPAAPPSSAAADEAARLARERAALEAQRRALDEERAGLAREEQEQRAEQARRDAGAARAEQAAADARAAGAARAEQAAADARAAEAARAEQAAADARAAEAARAEQAAVEARAAEAARAEQAAAEARAAEAARAEQAAAEARAAEAARAEQAAAEARAAEAARSEQAAAEARAERLRGLLDAASADVAALRLTLPPGENAFERYRAVLAMDPDNAEARTGLERIVARYLELASDAAAADDFARGASMLDRAADVRPEDPRLPEARQALERRRAAVTARQAGERAREEAETRARAQAEPAAPPRAAETPIATDVRWKAAEGTGCLVWNEIARERETVSWSGACVDGKASGRGELVWSYVADGKALVQRYAGTLRGGKLHGQGVLTVSNGVRYEGDFEDDMRHGRGTFTAPNGARYEGEWRDNERSGRGVQVWPDGGRYDGEWRRDRFHGQGSLTYSNGGHYDGQFFNDRRNGRGVLTWASGARYDGSWRNDERSGHGIATRPNGDRFEGEWRDDAPHGAGEAVIDGERYSGQWSNGCMRGGGEPARWGKTPSECGF